MGATGGGPAEKDQLTDLELKILDILGKHFLGVNEPECGIPSLGFTKPQSGTSRMNSPDHSTCISVEKPPAVRRKAIEFKEAPRKNRMDIDYSNVYKETITELRDIKATIKESLGEVATNLKEISLEIRDLNTNLIQVHILFYVIIFSLNNFCNF